MTMHSNRLGPHMSAGRGWAAACLIGAAMTLAGCASSGGNNSISGFDQVTIGPGDTAQCDSTPCTVFFKMPAGSGSLEVTGNQATVGTYPAGETVNLGSFWDSQAFAIKGMDVPKAYAYIPDIP